jgi:hypothetical protein
MNMVSKGNKDGHNYDYGYVRGVRVQEQEKWGRATAARRYGELRQTDMKPRDMSQPEDPGSRPDHSGSPRPFNDAKADWKLGARENATNMPGFDDHRPRGAAPRSPKAERPSNPGNGDVGGWLRDGGGSPFSRAGKR